jgi:hypothetical protein
MSHYLHQVQSSENTCNSVKPEYTYQLLLRWNMLTLEGFALHQTVNSFTQSFYFTAVKITITITTTTTIIIIDSVPHSWIEK